MKPIRVLIVDDSATMRTIIGNVLASDQDIQVVGAVGDALEARDAIKALSPDVITLDIEMPKMNGIEFLQRIMRLRPMPVIMISTLTQKGADIAIEALTLGAFECIGKPTSGDPAAAFGVLPGLIKAAANSKQQMATATSSKPKAVQASGSPFRPNDKIIGIGASTGGVDALLSLLTDFPENCPPTVITQHMPKGYTANFAARLDKHCAPRVVEAQQGMPLKPGTIYLAPGGTQHLEVTGVGKLICNLKEGAPVSGHLPSVDVMFNSLARYKTRSVGVILTGMGSDGALGLKTIRDAGGRTIGQDERSCVVYGMPRIAYENGSVEQQLRLSRICNAALALCDANERASA